MTFIHKTINHRRNEATQWYFLLFRHWIHNNSNLITLLWMYSWIHKWLIRNRSEKFSNLKSKRITWSGVGRRITHKGWLWTEANALNYWKIDQLKTIEGAKSVEQEQKTKAKKRVKNSKWHWYRQKLNGTHKKARWLLFHT